MQVYDANLLSDCLRLVVQEPSAAHVWHRLFQAARLAPAAHLQVTLAYVQSHVPKAGFGGFLAATCAYALTHEVVDLASAAEIFHNGSLPSDAGLALLHCIYAAALGSTSRNAQFEAMVHNTGFLRVADKLGQRQLLWPVPNTDCTRKRKLRRVAVVAPTLSTGLHAPTQMAIGHACVLQDCGLDVAVFSAQEFHMLDMRSWLGVPRKMNVLGVDPQAWPRPKRAMRIELADTDLSMDARWSGQLHAIGLFDPDVVLFIGPYSPLLTALHHHYPVVGLGINANAPIGPMDVWLAPKADAHFAWGPALRLQQRVQYTHRFSVPTASTARERSSLGLPQDAFVCVTTGNQFMDELAPHWCDQVLTTLDRHPYCHWLVVGMSPELIATKPIDHPRVHLRTFDAELPSLLAACNVYLNPPRMGGGYTVLIAMAQARAVLSLAGGDGGDKLGPWAHDDEQGYFAELARLIADPDLARGRGEALRQRYADTFDQAAGSAGLMAALQMAMERGQA